MGGVALASVALATGSALGSTVVAESVEAQVVGAPNVVRGIVVDSASAWDSDHRAIWTTTRIQVSEAIKGPLSGTISVKQPGGQVDDLAQVAEGAADFKVGEEVVLFLEPVAPRDGTYVVRGLASGKVSLTGERARRDLSGLAFVAKGRAAPATVREDLGTRTQFLARVRRAAHE